MKLKQFTLVESDEVYVFDGASESYISESTENTITLEDSMTLMEEGEISFSASDIMTEKKKDKKTSESDADDKDEDEEDEAEDELKEALADIFDFRVSLDEGDKTSLFESAGITEDAQENTAILFESLVQEKAKEIAIQAADAYSEYAIKLAEAKDIKDKSELNDYLDYVITEWMQENEIAIQSSMKTDLTENFMDGLKDLFEEHYIEVPDERYDILEGLAEKVENLTESLDEEIQKNVVLSASIKQGSNSAITKELSADLTESQKEKFDALLENIKDAKNDEFKEKATLIKESFFKTDTNLEDDDKSLGLIQEGKLLEKTETKSLLDDLITAASKL